MGFGAVGETPLDNVHFYNKGDPDKAFKIEKYQVGLYSFLSIHEKQWFPIQVLRTT